MAVVVSSPTEVSVFDQQMGESAEWASQWLGEASPGTPYTREVPALDTKLIGDSSAPSSVRFGIYLPQRTPSGYYSFVDNAAVSGTREAELPFVAWYSPTPVPAQEPLAVRLDLREGPNGWIANVTLKEAS